MVFLVAGICQKNYAINALENNVTVYLKATIYKNMMIIFIPIKQNLAFITASS